MYRPKLNGYDTDDGKNSIGWYLISESTKGRYGYVYCFLN